MKFNRTVSSVFMGLLSLSAVACKGSNPETQGPRVVLSALGALTIGMPIEKVRPALDQLGPAAEYGNLGLWIQLSDKVYEKANCDASSTYDMVTSCVLYSRVGALDLDEVDRLAASLGDAAGIVPKRFVMDKVLGTYVWLFGSTMYEVATVAPAFDSKGKYEGTFNISFGARVPSNASLLRAADRLFAHVVGRTP